MIAYYCARDQPWLFFFSVLSKKLCKQMSSFIYERKKSI